MVSDIYTALAACIFCYIYCSTITHKNAVAFYLLIQDLIVGKIYFLKFLSISDKAGLDQLKSIFTACSTILSESTHAYLRPIRKVEYPVERRFAKSLRLNQVHQ